MAVSIQIEVRGLDDVVSRLNRAGARKHDLMLAIAETARGQTVKRIAATKTDPDGAAWAALAASTWANKKAGGSIMVESGRLLGSVYSDVAGDEARIGTPVHYAKYHHTGTRKMPQRQAFGFGAQDITEIHQMVENFIGSLLS